MADLPNPKNRKELYLYDAATGRTGELPSPKTREELYLNEIANNSGGGGGTTNYNQLSNKPKVNNVELSGNKTTRDLIPIGNGLNFNEDGELEATGGGSGAVDSVNGKTGVVVLDAQDVGALPDDTDIPNSTSDLTNDSGFITNTVNNLLNYYLKSETYTQAEVNALISAIVTLDIQAVSTLPTEDISRTTIYLVPSTDPQSQNIKDEYINLDGTSSGWELIGSTEIDLTGYVTDTELTTALADYTTTANLTILLANKANASDVEDIETLIPSNASANNKLITLSDVPKGTATDCPIGMIGFFDDDTAPSGWLVADGTIYNISDYPFLASHYERVHGSKNHYGGNGITTFAVPDWRGEFFRASGPNAHPNQGSGGAVGEHQDGTEHAFIILNANKNLEMVTGAGGSLFDSTKNAKNPNVANANMWVGEDDWNMPSTYTSHPTNTSGLCCIKATPAGINYSLEEQQIGTWMGKKLYQKTFTGATHKKLSSTESSVVCYSNVLPTASLDKIVGFNGFVDAIISDSNPQYYTGKTDRILPLYYEDANFNYKVQYEKSGNDGHSNSIVIKGINSSNWFAFSPTITLQYTKTSD